MTAYSKYNIIYRLQKWLDSVPGQTFLNYAYSWGASIVILGTLFKLTHLPGANLMLYLGMGTEVVVFFISAFDRPFDKTAIGKELPTHLGEEGDEVEGTEDETNQDTVGGAVIQGGGTIVIGGGMSSVPAAVDGNATVAAVAGGTVLAGSSESPAWLQQQQQITPELEEATGNYVDELKKLTEMLGKVADQSERLTRDSEEMENLNRTLTGISKVYEMQLKSASAQMGTIDQINEQSRKMAEQIAELNRIYARMIEAMTVNMKMKENL
ncbi:MAG: gliding motility protein GldL [Prevotella sp.]